MSSVMNLTEEKLNDFIKVSISGEVDICTSQQLKDRLYNIMDTYKLDLKVDCKNLNYIDSTGLGIFVGTLKKARQYDKKIHMVNLKDSIKKLFLITGLDKLFIIE